LARGHPLVRFVVGEGEARTPTRRMTPESGNTTLNGPQLEGKTARAAAKVIRQAERRASDDPRSTRVVRITKA